MDSFQNALTVATAITVALMLASFGLDRLLLQDTYYFNVGENARKVWGVCILAVGSAIFLFKSLPFDVALITFLGLCCVIGLSGLADLLLHWAYSHAQLQREAKETAKETEALKGKIADLHQQRQALESIARGGKGE